jgi:hypothetical protein
MTWIADAPCAPSVTAALRDERGVSLEWSVVSPADGFPAVRYNVYAAVGDTVDVGNIDNLVAAGLSATAFRWDCRSVNDISMAVTAVDACGVESEPAFVSCMAGGSMQRGDVVRLPHPQSWGQRISVKDIYGTEVYYGKFCRNFNVAGFAAGRYSLTVYNRHGALLYKVEFVR